MLDTFIKLTEKLTELLKYRAERTKHKFEVVVEPIYLDMSAVHQDYLNMFGNILDSLEDGAELADVVKMLAKERRDHEASRRAALAKVLELSRADEFMDYRDFFSSVVQYFIHGPFEGATTPSNVVLDMIRQQSGKPRLLTHVGDFANPRAEIATMLHSLIKYLQAKWGAIVTEYTKAQATSIP